MGGNVNFSQSDNMAVYQMRVDDLIKQIGDLGYVHNKVVPEFLPLNDGTQKKFRDLITNAGLGIDSNEAFTRAAVRDYVIEVVKK
jgi:hypothetical protein